MPPTRSALIFRTLAALGLLAACLTLAACGSSSPSESAASAEDSALKFSKCMREHGVKDFPNPETAPGGGQILKFKGQDVNPATLEAAQKTCRHFQEEGHEGHEPSPQEKVEHEEQAQKFAKCMREHGIDMEVKTEGGGIQMRIGGPQAGGPSTSGPQAGAPKPSPAIEAAQKACQGLLPFKGKGGPGPGAVRAGG